MKEHLTKFDRAKLDEWISDPIKGTFYRKHELAEIISLALAVADDCYATLYDYAACPICDKQDYNHTDDCPLKAFVDAGLKK